MDRIANAKSTERQNIFTEVAGIAKLTPFVVEKDFWVSWILGRIFAAQKLHDILCFKGGTSLSKAFGLIKRFSEDIDLILAQSCILHPGETLMQPSNSKQDKFNKEIEVRAGMFITHELRDKLQTCLASVCEVQIDPTDDHTLNIVYPRVFSDSYIRPIVKLEIGPLALWNPNDETVIRSFVSDALPQLSISNPRIPTIRPARTFWEKLTILHHESHRPQGSTVPLRYSRHYYDAFMMSQTNVKNEAFENLDLLKEVTSFKSRFYPRKWAKYGEAFPGTFHLLPPPHNQSALRDDYENMKTMIYGDCPSWDEIITAIASLETEINSL